MKVLVTEHWPSVPGHGEQWKVWMAHARWSTESYVEVRRRRWGRWRWRPWNGMFVTVTPIVEDPS